MNKLLEKRKIAGFNNKPLRNMSIKGPSQHSSGQKMLPCNPNHQHRNKQNNDCISRKNRPAKETLETATKQSPKKPQAKPEATSQ